MFTFEPTGDRSWLSWDYALVQALQLIEDFSDGNGLLIWEKESDRVDVQAVRKKDKFEAAKEAITGRNKYKASPGEFFVPRLRKLSREWPTFSDWCAEQPEMED